MLLFAVENSLCPQSNNGTDKRILISKMLVQLRVAGAASRSYVIKSGRVYPLDVHEVCGRLDNSGPCRRTARRQAWCLGGALHFGHSATLPWRSSPAASRDAWEPHLSVGGGAGLGGQVFRRHVARFFLADQHVNRSLCARQRSPASC